MWPAQAPSQIHPPPAIPESRRPFGQNDVELREISGSCLGSLPVSNYHGPAGPRWRARACVGRQGPEISRTNLLLAAGIRIVSHTTVVIPAEAPLRRESRNPVTPGLSFRTTGRLSP